MTPTNARPFRFFARFEHLAVKTDIACDDYSKRSQVRKGGLRPLLSIFGQQDTSEGHFILNLC